MFHFAVDESVGGTSSASGAATSSPSFSSSDDGHHLRLGLGLRLRLRARSAHRVLKDRRRLRRRIRRDLSSSAAGSSAAGSSSTSTGVGSATGVAGVGSTATGSATGVTGVGSTRAGVGSSAAAASVAAGAAAHDTVAEIGHRHRHRRRRHPRHSGEGATPRHPLGEERGANRRCLLLRPNRVGGGVGGRRGVETSARRRGPAARGSIGLGLRRGLGRRARHHLRRDGDARRRPHSRTAIESRATGDEATRRGRRRSVRRSHGARPVDGACRPERNFARGRRAPPPSLRLRHLDGRARSAPSPSFASSSSRACAAPASVRPPAPRACGARRRRVQRARDGEALRAVI